MTLVKRILEERWLHFLGWFAFAASLPLSRGILSVSVGIIFGAWFFDTLYRKDLAQKWRHFKLDRSALLISGFFFLAIFGLITSSNVDFGVKKVIDFIPFLMLPLSASTMPMDASVKRKLLRLFTLSVLVSTVISYFYFLKNIETVSDPREATLFVNHIRLSLMVIMSMGIILREMIKASTVLRTASLIVLVWFIYFLSYMQSGTGFAIILLLLLFGAIWYVLAHRKLWMGLVLAMLFSGGIFCLIQSYQGYFDKPTIERSVYADKTALGNPYYHDFENLQTENGYYVWHFLAKEEMREAWNQVSEVSHDSGLEAVSNLEARLIRYLTSKGLHKDAAGVHALTPQDIQAIEKGSTSSVTDDRTGIAKRLDVIFFEWDSYMNGGNPTLNSVTRRLEYWKTGWRVFKQNSILGVGTGDLRDVMFEEYAKGSRLDEQAWDKSHNQYLSLLIMFGVVGFILSMIMLYHPLRFDAIRKDALAMLFIAVFSLSFIAEDTLLTQLGLSFFLFFFCILLLRNQAPSSTSR